MLILDYDLFTVTYENGHYIYHDKEASTTEELKLIAYESIEPFSDHDSDDYLLNAYPEADVTGESWYDFTYYWFKFKEGGN